ncbi:Putative odorant receptor 67c [Apis cerana cerana]|uniref:Odorant receptor 67c n=1 Tax=Apis cerana cerana TaxID=94128 RepID=A0A2A3E624_APICC|nr:Putative odorant receptor 67c [Apis cerana cerana]
MSSNKVGGDLSITVMTFYMKVVGFWIASNCVEERRRNLTISYTFFAVFFAMATEARDLYFTWGNFSEDTSLMSRLIFTFHLISCMCQLLMFTYSCDCLIRDSTNIANATYNSLWSFMPMDKYGKMLRKDLILVIMRSKSPCYLTALGFFPVSLETYISFLLKLTGVWMTVNEGEKRGRRIAMAYTFLIQVYGLYLNIGDICYSLDDLSLLTVQQIGIAYTCNDNFLCVLNMHVVCQFRILQHRLSKLWSIIDERADKINYASKCYEALKECIRHHQSLIEFCDKLEYVYTLPIFAHVVVFSLLMCFDTYEIFLLMSSTLSYFTLMRESSKDK